jgi:hypothetical protein
MVLSCISLYSLGYYAESKDFKHSMHQHRSDGVIMIMGIYEDALMKDSHDPTYTPRQNHLIAALPADAYARLLPAFGTHALGFGQGFV